MNELDATIARGLAKSHPRVAKLLGDRMTTVRPYPAPWLPSGQLCRIDHLAVHHPQLYFVAVAADGAVRMLTDDPDAFVAFARSQGVHLGDRDDAADYVRALLETTRATSKLVYVLERVDDIKFRPPVSGDEESRRDEFVATHRDVIRPPAAEPIADGWQVEAFVVVDQRVQRNRITVQPDGAFRAHYDVLADDLPLAVGR